MRMVDLIEKKKRGEALAADEISWMIQSYVDGKVADYQMSAMLMAIYFQGMNEEETTTLTLAMRDTGDVCDLSSIPGVKVDKHSTGGVGDKTTLIVAPIVAACGGRVAKMSGRGLGHTGGTIDKLDSIPGFKTALSEQEFFQVVKECGLAVVGQTGSMVPADKKLYALRDVTATVDCIPLIASSIMSKKLAAGSDAILLDVKTGSGAFMKTPEEAEKLAETMVKIGKMAGRRCQALITNMDIPLGRAIGNALEVREAISCLKGNGPADLTEECLNLASRMLLLCKAAEEEAERRSVDGFKLPEDEEEKEEVLYHLAREMAEGAIRQGRAAICLQKMIKAQGGDPSVVDDVTLLKVSPCSLSIVSDREGYIAHMDTEGIGVSSMLLGAGRARKEDYLDYGAGIILAKKTGDHVMKGETLAVMYSSNEKLFAAAEQKFIDSLTYSQEKPKAETLIYGLVK